HDKRFGADVHEVKEHVATEADVDKGGLQTGNHVLDSAPVNVTDDTSFVQILAVVFNQLAVFEECDSDVMVAPVDDHFFLHKDKFQNPCSTGGTLPAGTRAVRGAPGGAKACQECVGR